MKNALTLPLACTTEQAAQLQALQTAFARACNALAPLVQQTRCWNRVTLHHLAYKQLRERFPELGSQMICNAIYSVSRTGRVVFQHPDSPFNLAILGSRGLPLLKFSQRSPVYFDRHTLSVKGDLMSLYTLAGRTRIPVQGGELEAAGFHGRRLREALLTGDPESGFALTFCFAEESNVEDTASERVGPGIPDYIQVEAAP
jgi:hypothetical protein